METQYRVWENWRAAAVVFYDPLVRTATSKSPPGLALDLSLLKPGLRLAVGVSGGADSVALLLSLATRSKELGLVLHAAHLHHGLRGAEADADLEFCRALAAQLVVPFLQARVDAAVEAKPDPETGKPRETIEEAARRLRHAWFRELMTSIPLDAVATAHTLDDQAETVLAKFLRGAWTEGLSGIHPSVEFAEGRIIRPLLSATRVEIEAYLREIGQSWREDSTNRQMTLTRNRIRHELLPLLKEWNPQLREHLSQMAELARDEETWWQSELARLASQLLLPGRPVRGGGRSAGRMVSPGVALDVTRLRALPPALQRRLLRHAAEQLGASIDFPATERLRALALAGRASQQLELSSGLRAVRSARELQLSIRAGNSREPSHLVVPEYAVPFPGEINAPAFGLRFRIEFAEPPEPAGGSEARGGSRIAILRNWKAGDRVRLRHASRPCKVKEVLVRLRVTGEDRAVWPVLEVGGRILWMKGAEIEPEPGLSIRQLEPDDPVHTASKYRCAQGI